MNAAIECGDPFVINVDTAPLSSDDVDILRVSSNISGKPMVGAFW